MLSDSTDCLQAVSSLSRLSTLQLKEPSRAENVSSEIASFNDAIVSWHSPPPESTHCSWIFEHVIFGAASWLHAVTILFSAAACPSQSSSATRY